MAKRRTERVEVVVWRDAWSGYDSQTERAAILEGHYLASSGFLVKETKDEVILADQTTVNPGDTRVRHAAGILKKNIVSRRSWKVSVPEIEAHR